MTAPADAGVALSTRSRWLSRAGGLLLIVGLVQLVLALASPPSPRTQIAAPAPLRFASLDIAITERATPDPSRAYADLALGSTVFAGTVPVWIDRGAPLTDYAARYDGRFRFAAAAAGTTGELVIVEVLRERSDISHVVWRLYTVAADGALTNETFDLPAAAARHRVTLQLTGSPPARVASWPPLTSVFLGLLLLAVSRPLPRPLAWPSLRFVAVIAVAASLPAWPVMRHVGLARTLPGMVLGIVAALLAAALLGARAQARFASAPFALGLLLGAAFGGLLFIVFVAVDVALGAFVTPVFRPPLTDASPLGILVEDYGSPAFARLSVGLAPALLLGAGLAIATRLRAGRDT